MEKVAFLIDGWFMRKKVYKEKAFYYQGSEIRKYCKKHLRKGQEIYRIYYYDSEPLQAKGHNPISNTHIDFSQTNVSKEQQTLLQSIRGTPSFALRLGISKWKRSSWGVHSDQLKKLIKGKIAATDLTDKDVFPIIEQKGVDMKIGLDIATLAYKKLAHKLVVITGDEDMVPAIKLARKEGLIVTVDSLGNHVSPQLKEHTDYFKSFLDKYPSQPRS